MTAISLRQPVRLSRRDSSPVIAGIIVARFSTGHSRYPAGQAALHQQFKLQVGDIISRPGGFGGGFVDFLLGRSDRRQK